MVGFTVNYVILKVDDAWVGVGNGARAAEPGQFGSLPPWRRGSEVRSQHLERTQ